MRLILAFLSIAALCSCQPTASTPPPSDWIVYGDSVAYGTGANSPEFTPTGCLTQTLQTPVLNLAIPGLTSDGALENLAKVFERRPRSVLISIGGNDVLQDMRSHDFPAEKTEANLRKLFRRFKAMGVRVYYLNLRPPLESSAGLIGSLAPSMSWERLYRAGEVAQQEGALSIEDTRGWLWLSPNHMSDRIHPNDQGYQHLCEDIRSVIKSR